MARAWLINGRGLAGKVKNACGPAAHQIKDCGAIRKCPNCDFLIDNTDVSPDWPGLPAGVKFDPSDVELLEHLAAKCEVGDLVPHKFIDEFIPTIEGDEGICYTHPENLPGAKKDGNCVHFFYKIVNAYASGHRKRRKIQNQGSIKTAHVRWHKTGKTKALILNGVLKGFKKIMVLYETSNKGSKADKCHWVMHQYHLGTHEEERDGDFVVSKIFFQAKKDAEKNETSLVISETDLGIVQVVPRTPKTFTPDPPREGITPSSAYGSDDYILQSFLQDTENMNEQSLDPKLEDEMNSGGCLAEESEAVDLSEPDFFKCNEIIESYASLGDPKPNIGSSAQFHGNVSDVNRQIDSNAFCGISDLDNLELGTPPDFQLPELQFGSQDSVFDWLDRF